MEKKKKKPITNPKKLQECRFSTSNWINFVFDLILQLGSLKKWVGWILKRFSGRAGFNYIQKKNVIKTWKMLFFVKFCWNLEI